MSLSIREWFRVNHQIIYFIYGQVFFVLGLVIALQTRRHSRLNLARSLPWLAGFGFLHGFNEWGDLFLPIQSQSLEEPFLAVLYAFQHILLAASFACLLQFGVELLQPSQKYGRLLRFLPAFLFFAWLVGSFWVGLVLITDVDVWHYLVNALARYFLCIPGGWLSAFFIAPHPILRSLTGLVLTVLIVRALEVFDIEADLMIHKMEENQVIANERERIARDLHDGALQQVYAAGLLAQSLSRIASGPLQDGLSRLVFAYTQSQLLRELLKLNHSWYFRLMS